MTEDQVAGAAMEDVKMNETLDGVAASVTEASKEEAGSGLGDGSGDVTMGDGDDHEKMVKAARQIEFYFADSNLPYDKFMWTLYTKDPEHWIPIQTVASFKRMREYKAMGDAWVVKALRLSEELEVDETGTKVRRRSEVQEPKGQFERSVYAKGFPDEDSTLQGKLEEFFNKYGKVNAVRLRRDETKTFKNSVFVEFADFKSVDAFLKADPKPTWDGKELLIMSKQAYCDMKIKEKGLSGKAANHRRDLIAHGKGFDAFREMAKDKKSGKKEEKKDVYLEFMGTKILIHQDEEGTGFVKEEDVPFVKGSTLKFDGCGGEVVWSEIKDPIKEKFEGRAPFIKYTRGEDSGLVGFQKALSEENIALVRETIKTINSHEVTWSLPEESEEKEFLIERAQAAAKSALSSSLGGGRGNKGGRGGRGRGRGRGGRGGRGGGRDRNSERNNGGGGGGGGADAKEGGEEQAGEKRKRAVEPDGGPDVGVRGTVAPPVLQSVKKAKTEGGEIVEVAS